MPGPLLFSLYIAPISETSDRHGVGIHFYADDTQLYLRFKTSNTDKIPQVLLQIEKCVGGNSCLGAAKQTHDQRPEDSVYCDCVASTGREVDHLWHPVLETDSTHCSQVRNLGVVFGKHLNLP